MNITKKSTISEPSCMKVAFQTANRNDRAIEVYQDAPDLAAEIDSLEDILRERLSEGIPIGDILIDLLSEQRREMFQELMIKVLVLVGDSTNPALEIETLIAASGLPLREGVSNSAIASKFGLTRAAFSVRVQNMIKRLGIKRPRTLKREATLDNYKLSNRRNHKPTIR